MKTIGRRAASEVSLLMKVESNLDDKRSRRGGIVRGDQESAGKGGGGGYGRLLEEGGD